MAEKANNAGVAAEVLAVELRPTSEIIEELSLEDEQAYKKQELLGGLENALVFFPLKGELSRKEEAIQALVSKYFTLRMQEGYQQISEDILKLQRTVQIDLSKCAVYDGRGDKQRTSGQVKIDTPVFARTYLDESNGWSESFNVSRDQYSSSLSVKIESVMPRVPQEMRIAGRESIAYCHKVYAEALQTKILGDVLLEDPKKYANPTNAKLMVLWKPRPEDLSITVQIMDKDPILALKNPFGLYLVGTWEEKTEEPFMYFLGKHLK